MKLLFVLAACLATTLIGPAMAQERASTGSLDVETTWSNLTSRINSINAKVDGAKIRMAQVVLCGNKGMLYAPGAAGADASGCKAPAAAATLGACYQRAGPFGAPVACDSDEVVVKICSSGGDADCVAPGGTIYMGGQTAQDGWVGPKTPVTSPGSRSAYTVTACCKIK